MPWRNNIIYYSEVEFSSSVLMISRNQIFDEKLSEIQNFNFMILNSYAINIRWKTLKNIDNY